MIAELSGSLALALERPPSGTSPRWILASRCIGIGYGFGVDHQYLDIPADLDCWQYVRVVICLRVLRGLYLFFVQWHMAVHRVLAGMESCRSDACELLSALDLREIPRGMVSAFLLALE